MDVNKYLKYGETSTDFAFNLLDYNSAALVKFENFGIFGVLRMLFPVSSERRTEEISRIGCYLKERRGVNG